MSDEGIINTGWARRAVDRFGKAVADLNIAHPHAHGAVRVVWGYRNLDEHASEEVEPIRFQQQEGLLQYGGFDCEILLWLVGDPRDFVLFSISTTYGEPQNLPLTPRELYNTFAAACKATFPRLYGDREENRITVVGLQARGALDGLTGEYLYYLLSELRVSHDLVYDWLSRRHGDDYWEMEM